MSYSGVQPTFGTFPSDLFTANGSNTVFTMSSVPGNDAALLVTIDGVRQHTDTYSYSANTLTFSEAPANGAIIETVNMGSRADVIITDGVYRRTQFTATAAQTNFDISTGYTIGFVDVYLNGIRLVVGDDYTAADGSTIILAVPAATGDSVEVVAYGTFNIANALQKSGDTMSGNFIVTGTSTLNAPVAIANTTGNTVTFATTGAVTFNSNVAATGTLTVNNVVTFDNSVQGSEGLVLARSGQTLNFNANYSASNTKATITTSAGMALALVTNGSNDKLHINANGHITMPYQPNFAMSMTATSVTRGAVLPFNTTLHNVGSHYNTSTYRFTAPVSGTYYFSGHFRLETSEPTMAYHRFILQINGNQINASMGHLTDRVSGNYSSVSVAMLVNMTAGDYVSPYFACNLTGTTGTTPQECYFGGYLVG